MSFLIPSIASSGVESAIQDAFAADQVITPGKDHQTLQNSYLSNTLSDLEPAAIFLPRNEQDITKFVRIVEPYVFEKQVRFAVRGSGQQPTLRCSNIEDGITVDLRNLTGITLKDDNKTLSIGAGENRGKVYSELQKKGLAVTGGRSNNGGIGGLSLSGGLSFFSSREGFIADNVTNFRVVLASGQVVDANQQENTDLFVSLKGGGNNFDIVTQYDSRTFEQGRFWGGYVMYFPNSFPGQIEAYVKELQKPDATPDTHIMVSAGYSAAYAQISEIMCLNQVYYLKEQENPRVLEPFVSMQPQLDQLKTSRTLDLVDAANEQSASGSNHSRVCYSNTTVKPDVATLIAAYEIFVDAIKPIKDIEGLATSLTLQAYPRSLLARTSESGGNSLGITAEKRPLMSILLLAFWKAPRDNERIYSVFKSVIEAIDKDSSSKGTVSPYKYLDYAAAFQDPIRSYGEKNRAHLQATSRKYDPKGLFQKGVPGGFKLFE